MILAPKDKVKIHVTKCTLHGRTKCSGNQITEAQYVEGAITVMSYVHGKISGRDSGISVRYRLEIVS